MNPGAKTLQRGAILFEALIAILIFSLGVLGIVGLQARMVIDLNEAKYRNEASFFVNRLIGDMWGEDRSDPAAMEKFASGKDKYNKWYASIINSDISKGQLGLPGADLAGNEPEVTVTPVNNPVTGHPVSYDVTATVKWQAPGEPVHRHTVTASITAD